jgi:sporulation related protein
MPSSFTPKLALWALIPVLASVCGCAIPPALTIASFAVNAVSYAATGKSVTDHGLSAVVGEDCALWRAVADRKICRDDQVEPAGPAVAEAAPDWPKVPAVAEATDTKVPERTVELASVPEARRFLVLGSFINRDNAKHLAASLGGVETTIVAVGKDGSTFHRVIAGPLDDVGVKALWEQMVLEAGVRPWEITEPPGEAPSIGTPTAAAATRDATALMERPAIVPPPI